jgi:DNA-binding CsgD family transcriptional regulator/tetratricopeptide (TPR) repeat protein
MRMAYAARWVGVMLQQHAGLVGRDQETTVLLGAAKSVLQRGAASTVLLTGEAGSGKTRLVQELTAALTERGWRTAAGYGLPGQGVPPYYALSRVIRQLSRDEGASGGGLGEVLPILAAAGIGSGGSGPLAAQLEIGNGRLRLFEALAQVLERAAAGRPLLVTLDDMQWAGSADWEAMEHATRFSQQPLLFLVAARAPEVWDETSNAAKALRELSRNRLLTQVQVGVLDHPATAALVEAMLGGPASEELSAAIFERSGGNPFFAEELVGHLSARGALLARDGTWHLIPGGTTGGIPPTVELAVRDRLQAVPADARSLLEVAAVIGRQVDSSVLARATGVPVLSVVERLAPAAAAGIVSDVGSGWTFRHDLVREAILASVRDRPAIHGRIAEAMADSGEAWDHARQSALAHHWLQAGRNEEAARAAVRASALASSAYAPDEALQLARQAATAVRDVSGRGRYELECACLLRLGDAAMESGEFAGAREAFASLAQLGQARADRPREGSALLRLGDLAKRREQPQEAERNFRQGLAMLEGSEGSIPETIHGLIELTELCGMTLADYPAAEAFGKRALQLCDESGDRGREAEAVVALASAETRAHGPRAARRALEDALERAVAAHRLDLAAEIAASLSNNYYWTGELRRSRHFGERRLEYATRAHDIFGLRHAHSWLALVACSQGEFQEALELLEKAEPLLARLDSPEPVAFVRVVSAFVHFQLGDAERAYVTLREGFDSLRPLGDGTLIWYGGLLAYIGLAAGRTSEAMAELADQEARLAALPLDALPARSARCALGMIYSDLGDREKGLQCEEALRPYSEDFHWWPVRRTLVALAALRGDAASALAQLDVAIPIAREAGQQPDLAAMLCERAALLPVSDPNRGRALEEAKSLVLALGMPRLVDRVEVVRALAPDAHPFGLTPRELDVLRLLCGGKTNREIAEALVISERTVINHLSHIFGKLQVENRASATALAIRQGLA